MPQQKGKAPSKPNLKPPICKGGFCEFPRLGRESSVHETCCWALGSGLGLHDPRNDDDFASGRLRVYIYIYI